MAAASAAVGLPEAGNCPNRARTAAVSTPAARPTSPPVSSPTTSISDPTNSTEAQPSTIVAAEPSHPGIGRAVHAEETGSVTGPTSSSPTETVPVPIANQPTAEAITKAPVTTP